MSARLHAKTIGVFAAIALAFGAACLGLLAAAGGPCWDARHGLPGDDQDCEPLLPWPVQQAVWASTVVLGYAVFIATAIGGVVWTARVVWAVAPDMYCDTYRFFEKREAARRAAREAKR